MNISGDLYISIDTIKSNAEFYDTNFKNELLRVIVHGVLHLLGYNDCEESEKIVMREREDFYLNRILNDRAEI